MKTHALHPSPQDAEEDASVYPSRPAGKREREKNRRIHIEIFLDLPDPLNATSPVPDASVDARQVCPAYRPQPRVLDIQDPISLPGKTRHQFLVTLPVKIPVNRRDTNDIFVLQHLNPHLGLSFQKTHPPLFHIKANSDKDKKRDPDNTPMPEDRPYVPLDQPQR